MSITAAQIKGGKGGGGGEGGAGGGRERIYKDVHAGELSR